MQKADRIKCLLVDDIEENLIALEALLQRDDLEILKARSGPQALEVLLDHMDIALALIDVQMPDMNGFELAELMRGSERTRHIPLIFMTAGSRERNWQFKGYESGAVDFLYKPIDAHMLITKAQVFFELHRRKQELAYELRERTEALRINEMFMAVLSHDLRTPLMSIKAAATVIKRQTPPETKTKDMAEHVLKSTDRMQRMIEDLLDVVRIRQAGGLSLLRKPGDMAVLIHGPLEELRTSFPLHPIVAQIEGDTAGVWDAERLCQVITNLVGNAVHHGALDEPVRVLVDGRRSDTITLEVHNAGTIPPELLPHLFDAFRGRERPPGRHQGLGLGLYIANRVVTAHHGQITVLSQEGRTRFRVVLPRHTSEEGTLQNPPDRAAQ